MSDARDALRSAARRVSTLTRALERAAEKADVVRCERLLERRGRAVDRLTTALAAVPDATANTPSDDSELRALAEQIAAGAARALQALSRIKTLARSELGRLDRRGDAIRRYVSDSAVPRSGLERSS